MNIVRLYNQNRKKVWLAILIIASIIIGLKLLNYFSMMSSERSISRNTSQQNLNVIDNNSVSKAISKNSGVSGYSMSETDLKETQNILDTFYGYCNNKQLDKAYELLTDKCKQLIYPNLQVFANNYYKNVFQNQKKIYSFENWSGNTYRVIVEEDALATGKVSEDIEKKIDYVTIIDNKLNISTYIGSTEINKEASDNGITVMVKSKDEYMNYVTYNIIVKNNNSSRICLADIRDSLNIYLLDKNGVRYGVYNNRLVQNRMILNNNETVNLSLRFYSSYVSTKEMDRMIFKKAIFDYGSPNQKETTLSLNIKE